MFFPVHATWSYWQTLWNAFMQELTDAHFREEMLLQLELAGSDCSPRTLKRLDEIGPAARAFLAHQRLLIGLGHSPIIHAWQRYWLRVFVLNFLELERGLAHRAGLKHATWRVLHEERLVGIVSANERSFAQVITFGQLPSPVQAQVVQGFAEAVGIPGATESVPVQMS